MAEGRGRAQSSGHVRSGSPLAQKEEAVVEWEIGFDDLSRELIVALTANPAYPVLSRLGSGSHPVYRTHSYRRRWSSGDECE